jgi:putative ABC transport system substrate-binding protein
LFICSGCGRQRKAFNIGILQWTDRIEAFKKTYQGLIDGLKDRGYKEGLNLRIDYKNAEQNKELALKAARTLVDESVDVIVSLGTGSTKAALKATEKNRLPIVYSIVGAPRCAGIIRDFSDSGRNLTGVSMKVPVKEQFLMVKEAIPKLKKLGIIYCTEMSQAVCTGKEAKRAAIELGWTSLAVSFPRSELAHLPGIASSLARKVDAIYIPTDPILDLRDNLKTIIKICDKRGIPVIAVAEKFVEEGALMATHCDFYEIGREAAYLIEKVLNGINVRSIPSQKPNIIKLSLNLKKANPRQKHTHFPTKKFHQANARVFPKFSNTKIPDKYFRLLQ